MRLTDGLVSLDVAENITYVNSIAWHHEKKNTQNPTQNRPEQVVRRKLWEGGVMIAAVAHLRPLRELRA
jgi:hypothetical protein